MSGNGRFRAGVFAVLIAVLPLRVHAQVTLISL